MRAAALAVTLASATAVAEPARLAPQAQLDGGLSVIGLGYEHPVARQLAAAAEVMIFGSYFLPWFDAGDRVKGVGLGVRPTWFARETGHGLYVTPYFRGLLVDEKSLFAADGVGFTTGVFVGWAFGLTETLDLRIGAGAQYIHFHVNVPDARLEASTPFVALDAVLGYRL